MEKNKNITNLKLRDKIKTIIEYILPAHALIPLVTQFSFNSLIYFGIRLFDDNWKHYDLSFWLDKEIPLVPQFISIYFVCYVFWVINYILMARMGEKHYYRFAAADLFSRVICGLFFVLLPTQIMRPEITGSGMWNDLMRMLYQIDEPNNLFPSIHCLVSWFCYIGIRGKKEIPLWYRVFSCVFALLVCASTVFVKQHFVVDIAGGILLAEVCYYLSGKTKLYVYIQKFFTRINRLVWGKESRFGG